MSKGPSIMYVRNIFRKTDISNPLIRTCTCAYQGVRNGSFSENFAYVYQQGCEATKRRLLTTNLWLLNTKPKFSYVIIYKSVIISLFPGFEIRRESASLTRAKTRQNHSTRVFSDSFRSFVRLSSSNDNFHNNLPLNDSNTLIFHFFR